MSKASSTQAIGSTRLARYFKDYSDCHKSRGNQISHYFGISFIVVSLLGLLGSWVIGVEGLTGNPYFRLDGGVLLLCFGVIWYFFLDWRLSVPFSFVLSGLYFLGRAMPVQLNWILFVVGWIFQGIGHAYFEKKSPAFFRNLTHLMIGPLWIFAKVIGYSIR